jgi:hypothetical protein
MTRAGDLLGVGGLCIILAGCATSGGVSNASAGISETHAAAARLTLDTPIGQICDDPRGRAVLDRTLPGLRKNPNYFLFQGWSLRQLAGMSNGRITPDTLERVRLDLAAVSDGRAAAGEAH